MPAEDELIVSSSMIDGKFTVMVTRIATYRGELTIVEGNQVLHREDVLLSFDALFGRDVADVASWQEAVITFVDSCSNRSPRIARAISAGACAQHRTAVGR